MLFYKSNSMKIVVLPEQEKQLSPKEKILSNCKDESVIAFDIYAEETLVGFAMLRQYDTGCYFLWNFAIDYRFQNRHYGTKALQELITMMNTDYHMHTMTTTYKFGNKHAKHIYEKIGFTETDLVIENNYSEVNMIYYCK